MKLSVEIRKYSSLVAVILGPTAFLFAMLLFSGCGETPSGPPKIEPGAIEIYAYIDSAWVDSLGNQHDTWLAPIVNYVIDDSLIWEDSAAVPALVGNLLPGEHKVSVEYGDYNTTYIEQVNPGDTIISEPVMTKYAPDFNEPGVRYDISGDSIVYTDSISLDDHSGEVILLFYFGAT